MKNVYFDNAATTKMLPEVIEVMMQSMQENYGNPSSTHQVGRKAKVAIETARKKIAKHFNVSAKEIIFTSGGTEGNNLVLKNAVENLGVTRIITTKIEHHAVLDVVKYLENNNNIKIDYLEVNDYGEINLAELEDKLSMSKEVTLVTLMYVNNEIGNLLPVEKVALLCEQFNAFFHTDGVQAVGRYSIDLKNTSINFLVASAHKFHGPKGVGFLYSCKKNNLKPMILGGGQERGVRSGTENVYGVLAMQKALEISMNQLEEDNHRIFEVKEYLKSRLISCINKIEFNGLSGFQKKASNTILNVRFPFTQKNLLFNLDLMGISASSGSACQSGANKVSHVLKEILNKEDLEYSSIRFSFSKFSTKEEVDYLIDFLLKNYKKTF